MYRNTDEITSSENLNKNDSNEKISDKIDLSRIQIRHSYEET